MKLANLYGNSTEPTSSVVDELPESSVREEQAACNCCSSLDVEELRRAGAEIGYRVVLHSGVTVDFPEKIVLGDDVEIGAGVLIKTAGGVTIGDRTIVGPGVKILSSVPKVPSGIRPIFGLSPINMRIEISHDVYVGPNAILMPNIYVGSGAVVGPGAVLTNNLHDYKLLKILTTTQSKNRSET